jgi:hypothetical protein
MGIIMAFVFIYVATTPRLNFSFKNEDDVWAKKVTFCSILVHYVIMNFISARGFLNSWLMYMFMLYLCQMYFTHMQIYLFYGKPYWRIKSNEVLDLGGLVTKIKEI